MITNQLLYRLSKIAVVSANDNLMAVGTSITIDSNRLGCWGRGTQLSIARELIR